MVSTQLRAVEREDVGFEGVCGHDVPALQGSHDIPGGQQNPTREEASRYSQRFVVNV